MDDYIRRSAAVACCGEYLPGAKLIAEEITQIPAEADVVKVVRCEDCAYWNRFRDSRLNPNHGVCFKHRVSPIVTHDRFFCAGGNRKEMRCEKS